MLIDDDILNRARTYVGDLEDDRLEEAFQKVNEHAEFKCCIDILRLEKDLLPDIGLRLESTDLVRGISGCDEVAVIAGTLGIGMEYFLRRVQRESMGDGVVCDAMANAVLERLMDDYEKSAIRGPRTFRFAPGYGDIPIALNKILYEKLKIGARTGIVLTSGGMFVPQKSILGMIGIGGTGAGANCGHCILARSCGRRNGGRECWKN